MTADRLGSEGLRGGSVLLFGTGAVGLRVARRLKRLDCALVAGVSDAPAQPVVGALVSLEALEDSACALALKMFSVVEALEHSRMAFPDHAPRVVAVVPGPGAPERLGLQLARTLALYLGAPSRVRFNVVQVPPTQSARAAGEAADLSVTLLLGQLDGCRGRVFRIGPLADRHRTNSARALEP